jgi:hypothetical protein
MCCLLAPEEMQFYSEGAVLQVRAKNWGHQMAVSTGEKGVAVSCENKREIMGTNTEKHHKISFLPLLMGLGVKSGQHT